MNSHRGENDMENKGVIYILTNPSFREYVKIGYADDVKVRVSQLNTSECTPFAFRIYATLNVPNRLADKGIHALIDKFKPELRAKDNVNGKIRVREFFAISPQEAFELLSIIGSIYGETPKRYEQSKAAEKEESVANEVNINSERRAPLSFYKCGIKNGDYIFYVNDENIKCKVVNDRSIEFKGKKTSVSALAQKLLCVSHPVQGTLYFTYKGELLSALRKRLEDEGKYELPQEKQLKEAVTKENHGERTSKPPFSFFKCGIKKGDKIVYKNDSTISCIVVGDRTIEYNGVITSVSALAQKLLGYDYPVQGTLHFTYNGEILADLRARLETEEKY